MGLRIVGGGFEEARVCGVQCGIEDLVAEMGAEHDLRIVAGRSVAVERVVADEVARPLHAAGVDVDEERRIGGHDDDVAVALQAGHPGGVAEGRAEVGGGRAFARGPFADEDFGPAAIVAIVAVDIDERTAGQCGRSGCGVRGRCRRGCRDERGDWRGGDEL